MLTVFLVGLVSQVLKLAKTCLKKKKKAFMNQKQCSAAH